MKKRLLAIVLATLMLCSLLSFSILATTDITPGDNETEDVEWGNLYTVTLPTNTTGYTIATEDATSVNENGSFTFTVTIADGYNGDAMVVKANDVVLNAIEGVYTIADITANQTVTVEGVVEAEEETLKGDFNDDGDVTVKDVAFLRRYIVGLVDSLNGDADFNDDGDITVKDVAFLRRYIVGLIDSL